MSEASEAVKDFIASLDTGRENPTFQEMQQAIETGDNVLRVEYLGLIGTVKELLDEVNGEVI